MRKAFIGLFLSIFLSVSLFPAPVLAQEGAEKYYLYSYFDGKFSSPVERRLFELIMFSGESDENDTVLLKNLTVACEENLFESVYLFLDEGEEYDLASENRNGKDYFSYSGGFEFGMNSPQLNIWGDITDVAKGRLVQCSLEQFEVFSDNGRLISLDGGINDGLDKIERNFFEYGDEDGWFDNENAELLSINSNVPDLYFNRDNQNLVLGDFTFQDGVVLKEIYLECRNGGLFDEMRFQLDGDEYKMHPTLQSQMYLDYDFDDYSYKEVVQDRVIFRTIDLDIKLRDLDSSDFKISFDVDEMRFMDEFPNCSSNIRFEFEDKIYGTSNFFINSNLFHSYWNSTEILKRSHYSEESMEVLNNIGIIEGYADGKFRPNTKINRAEMSKILAEAYLEESEFISESCFDDVLKEDWFSKYVCALKRKGHVSGDDYTNNFRPGDGLNFAESMKMIVEVLEFDLREGNIPGRDFDEKEYWHGKYITTAMYNGFYSLDYYEVPGRDMLRGDAFMALYFAMNSKENSELREEFVLAVDDLIDYVEEYKNLNGFKHHTLMCERDSFDALEKAQNLYATLMSKDAHLDLSHRWDIIDHDEKYAFWIASDFINEMNITSVPVMIESGCLELLKEHNFTNISEIDALFYDDGFYPIHNSRFRAIHYGVMSGDIGMVDYLLGLGADVTEIVYYIAWHHEVGNEYQLNSFHKPLSTALHILANSNYSSDRQIAMAKHLVTLGVDLSEENDFGQTALDIAEFNNYELAKYLRSVCEGEGIVCE